VRPEVALATADVEYDVLGFGFDEISPEHRQAVLAANDRAWRSGVCEPFATPSELDRSVRFHG
jgi:hypothetical protein